MADLRSYFQGFDLDTGGGTDLVVGFNIRMSASGGSIEAKGQQAMASSIPVVIASDQTAVSVSGGSEVTPTNPATDYVTSASLAAGSEANLDTGDLPAKKLWQVTAWASSSYRARVFLVNNGSEGSEALAVGGGDAMEPWTWLPPHRNFTTLGTSAGTDAFRVEMTNLDDANAADVHAVFCYADN